MGKARDTDKSFAAEQQKINAQTKGLISASSNPLHGQFFLTPDPLSQTKKLLEKCGGVMNGAIGWNSSKIPIISDTIDIGGGSGKYAGFVILEAETGTTDDLSTIDNFQLSYQDLTLLAKAGHTITITNVGNIELSSSLTLTDSQAATLFFDILTNKWKVKGGIGAGGGGSSIIENIQLGNVSGPLNIDLNSGIIQRNFIFELIGDTTIAFINDAIPGTQTYPFEMEISQGTTPFLLTFPPSVLNTIDISQPNTTNIVVFQTSDGGITYSAFVAGSKSSGAVIDVSQWSTFPAVSDVNFATFDGINIDRLLFDQAAGESLAATDVGITSSASGDILANVLAAGFYRISGGATDIVEFDDTTGLKILGTHVINMNKNVINMIGSTQWDRTATFTPLAIDTIGFDDSTKALKYNVALTTDIHSFQAAGELLASISRIASNSGQLSIDAVVSNLLQANEQVFLGSAATPAPLLNGAFWRDSGTGLFQFRENGVTVGLGGGFSGNLSDLVIDANKDWATRSITNMAAIQYVDAGSVVRGSISGDATLGLVLSTVAGGKFTIQDVITPIATFDDTVGLKIEGTHVINMNKNIINTIGSTQWDRTSTFTPTAIDTIGFDTATMALKYNVALTTDIHSFQAAGELLGSITRINPNVGALLMNGVGSVVQADILSATDKIITNNGFEIQNTSSSITTFAIPNNEFLKFTDGGVEVGQYDADNDNWVFNPANDVRLSPTVDIDLTPGGDVIMNPTGEMKVFADLDMQGTNTIDMGTSASSSANIPAVADGYFQIKENGVTRFVPFFDNLPI